MLTHGHWSSMGPSILLPNLERFEYRSEMHLDLSIITNLLLSRSNTSDPDISDNITKLGSAILTTVRDGRLGFHALALVQLHQLAQGMHIELITPDESWP